MCDRYGFLLIFYYQPWALPIFAAHRINMVSPWKMHRTRKQTKIHIHPEFMRI